MVPKLMTIVADCYGNSDILKRLRKHDFIYFAEPDEIPNPPPGHTLIYGYALAKEMFEFVSIGDYFINDSTRWTFNEFESRDDVYVDEWIRETINHFFKYNHIKGQFGNEALQAQLAEIDRVFIYNGNHELYLYDSTTDNCYAWSHEEISYRLDTTPEAFACTIANHFLDQKRAVYAWDPHNLKTVEHAYNHVMLFIRDIAYAAMGVWLEKSDFSTMLAPTHKLTTPEFMKYVSHLPDIYHAMETKDYMRRLVAGEVEQLYSMAEICIDRSNLLAEIKRRNLSGADATALEKIYKELDSHDMVQVPYMSRNKITGRLFPNGGAFNPITTSDAAVLSSVVSRHQGGTIVSFDFETFEPAIMTQLLELPIAGDIHTTAAGVLNCDRTVAKKINNMVLYGASEQSLFTEFENQKIGPDQVERYLQMMAPTIERVDFVQRTLNERYEVHGFFRNAFGRIIRPRSRSGVFNNYIASIASDVFNTASSLVFDLLRDRESKLFMHKFDELFVDVHPDETDLIDEIVDILSNKLGIAFKVKVSAGRNLASLKAL